MRMEESTWQILKETIDQGGLTCQMCGAALGDIDDLTGRKVRLHLGEIKVESLGSLNGLPDIQTLCTSCKEGRKNFTGEKPTAIWLLSQVRRAGQDEQLAVFEWLLKKFGNRNATETR